MAKPERGREYFAALNTFKELEQSLSLFFNRLRRHSHSNRGGPALAGHGTLSQANRWTRSRPQDACGLYRICQHFRLPWNQHSMPIPPRTVCRSVFNSSLRKEGTVFCVLWQLSLNPRTLGPNSLRWINTASSHERICPPKAANSHRSPLQTSAPENIENQDGTLDRYHHRHHPAKPTGN